MHDSPIAGAAQFIICYDLHAKPIQGQKEIRNSNSSGNAGRQVMWQKIFRQQRSFRTFSHIG